MNRRRAVRLSLIAVALVVVTALAGVATWGTVLVRRPFPQRSGEVAVPGLSAQVRVVRDDRGVPQIYASTSADLFRAQGWVTASDRFFEMDVRRRLAAGRLSELLGDTAGAVQADVLMRTLGVRRVAEQELASLDPATRAALQAFADGVNDYTRGRSTSRLSLDYTLLARRHDVPPIEEWTPVDSLAWLKVLAWDLRLDDRAQLGRALAYQSVRDVRRVEQLYPAYPAELNPPVLAAQASDSAGSDASSDQSAASPATTAGDGQGDAGGTAAAGGAATTDPGGADAGDDTSTAEGKAGQTPDDELGAALLSASASASVRAVADISDALPGGVGAGEGIGSNAWAVAGSRTASGKPLLVDDLHLSTSQPGALYQIGLHCTDVATSCPYDVSGFTFAGLPGVLIGHNGAVAWGLSSLAADTCDLYLERLSADGRGYERDGQTLQLTARQEQIRVADGPTRTITVRSTGHGPLLSDVAAGQGGGAPVAADDGQSYAVSVAWAALTPGRTMDGVLALNVARDPAQVQSAAARFSAPAEAIVYATADHIGFVAAGSVPTRRGGRVGAFPLDGTWPLPGWQSRADWTSVVDAARLPRVLDPADNVLVAANQQVAAGGAVVAGAGGAAGAGVVLGGAADAGYRAHRIRELVERAGDTGRALTTGDAEGIQADTRSPAAEILVPRLLSSHVDAFTEEAQDLLRGWDYTQPEDSAAAAYFNAVWATLLDLTFADELPEGTRPDGGGRWVEVVRVLLDRPDDPWWDDRRTPGLVETRDAMLQRALQTARLRLTSTIGKDPSRWRWGKLHSVTLRHLGGDTRDGWWQTWLDEGPRAAPGGSSVVDSFSWDASAQRYSVEVAPAMRMVVDLSNLDGSRWVNQAGQSAHPFDSHYGDQTDAWLNGESFAWPSSKGAVDNAAEDVLTMTPGD